MSKFKSTKLIELGSTAFRQWTADHSHCKYLHGYQLKTKLWFGCNELDEKNWAVDFGGLKVLKSKLQHVFDHTTTVAADDPELEVFKDLDQKGIIQLRVFENGVGIERCAEVVYEIAQEHINNLTGGRCWVDSVEVFEHEENSAIYTAAEATQKEVKEVKEVKEEKVVQEEKATEAPVVDQPVVKQIGTPAPVGKTTTKTKGGWFEGTTWG
jgi:6-pyruvoyltetrahydropterin/6-carboxytetrahydropterin synthase